MVNLVCDDGCMEAPLSLVQHLVTLQSMLEGTVADEDVPVPNISVAPLRLLLTFVAHHVEAGDLQLFVAPPDEPEFVGAVAAADREQKVMVDADQLATSKRLSEPPPPPYTLTAWDTEFFNSHPRDMPFALLKAADDMGCEMAMLAAAAAVAAAIRGKSKEEIQAHYELEPAFTAEQEAQLLKELAALE